MRQEVSDGKQNKKKKLSIIIPCYNEELGINYLKEQIDPVLKEIQKQYQLELLFIDDGSKDNTLKLLKETFGKKEYVKIIPHGVNKNLGQAIRTGFAHATGDLIATMDSDCTYNPKGILEMLTEMKQNPQIDIITASPYHPKGEVAGVPKWRLVLSFGICLIYRILTRSNIHTFTALFRIQKREIAKTINFQSDDFLATAELIVYPLLLGYKVKEYPTVLHIRKFGQSKMRLLLVIRSHFLFIFKLIKLKILRNYNTLQKQVDNSQN